MRRSWWEAGAVALLLGVLAAAVFGPNAVDGGFLSDAWANRSIYVFAPQEGFLGAIDQFMSEPNVAARPLYAVYLVALNGVLGEHMGLWLAWLAATSVLMSVALYLLLRKLDFAFLDAAVIAALVLIFPAASSLRLWAAVVQIPVAVSLALFGFLLALYAFEGKGRKKIVLHGLSMACFVTSLLFYEAALGVMLASILLYRLKVPWQAAGLRWVMDVLVLVSVAAYVGTSSTGAKEVQSLDGMWRHATEIFDQSRVLFATVVLPFAGAHWYVLALIALLPAVSILIIRRASLADSVRSQLWRWLAVLLAGILVVTLGYAIFVPGIDYYAPMEPGIANRVNAVPSIGWVLVLYALVMLGATLVFRSRPNAQNQISALAAAVCILIGGGWIQQVDREADDYTQAFREGKKTLAAVHGAIPSPAPASTIWTFGQPVQIAPGIPVFGNTWDMTSAVQLMYDDAVIKSYVGYPETTFKCTPYLIEPGGNISYPPGENYRPSEFSSAYGKSYFVDTVTGRWVAIQTPAQCRQARRSFERSPSFPLG